MQNFCNPYQSNMYGNPMPQMHNRPMFPEPQQYMQSIVPGSTVWIKNRFEAENYATNVPVTLWDSSGPYVHRKEIDSSGRQAVRTFKVTEVTDAQPTSPASEFVTREEFMQFVSSLNYTPRFAQKEEIVNE